MKNESPLFEVHRTVTCLHILATHARVPKLRASTADMLDAATSAITGLPSAGEVEEWVASVEPILLSRLHMYAGKNCHLHLITKGCLLFLFIQLSILLTNLYQQRIMMGWFEEDQKLAFLVDCLKYWIWRIRRPLNEEWYNLDPAVFVQAHGLSFRLSCEISDMCSGP